MAVEFISALRRFSFCPFFSGGGDGFRRFPRRDGPAIIKKLWTLQKLNRNRFVPADFFLMEKRFLSTVKRIMHISSNGKRISAAKIFSIKFRLTGQ